MKRTYKNYDDTAVAESSSRRLRSGRVVYNVDDEQVHDSPHAPPPLAADAARSSSAAKPAGRPASVWLTDSDMLDCFICFHPLTVPVFQCENGHAACSSCCSKIRNKCPSCTLPIGFTRCRAIEKVLECATKACRYKKHGCKGTLLYSRAAVHEKACEYRPRSCPFAGCGFVSSSKKLSLHVVAKHPGSVVRFLHDDFFKVKLDAGSEALVLQEEKGDGVFLLHRREDRTGSVIWLSSLSHDPSKVVKFDVWAQGKAGTTLSMFSIMMCSHDQGDEDEDDDDLPSEGFFVIPSDFFGESGEFAFDLNIC